MNAINGNESLPPPENAGGANGFAIDLVRRWRELSELERRAFGALIAELNNSSELVEKSTLDLSARFQELAGIAESQVARTDLIIATASAIELQGGPVPLNQALAIVETTIRQAVETIVYVSKHAMRMVYTLDDVARDVAEAAQCSGQIEVINRQARYLAINAAIEASRSGAAGAAFSVIANEMKALSHATGQTAEQVRDRIQRVTDGVKRGHDVMRSIATMDLSENIMAKERIDDLLAGIKAQHGRFDTILADAAQSSNAMAATVVHLITGVQFQDRTKQHIAQVIDTIAALAESAAAIQAATDSAFPGLMQPGGLDQAALDRMLDRQTLGDMKIRLLARLLDDGSAPQHPSATDDARFEDPGAADIEMF